MHIKSFRVQNFRRLKNVRVDLEQERTIFVGANNSGKTSATHLFQLFLGQQPRAAFQIYDFTADCWDTFNSFDLDTGDAEAELPRIVFDLWFTVDDDNLHRVLDLLPDLDWNDEPVGVRLTYAPRDGAALIANYSEALAKTEVPDGQEASSFKPWPQSMVEYLTKRLQQEYEIKYFVLDAKQCDSELIPDGRYEPQYLGSHNTGASQVVDSIVRIDFLNAQRHLSDESHGRSEDLSKRLSRYYERNLQKIDSDLEALDVIADSEERLNAHFAEVFQPVLDRLGQVGYPGLANPGLVVKASFNALGILSTSAKVHYSLPDPSGGRIKMQTLPDQYNGLGFKNLIFMVVEVLDFHQAWILSEQDRAPIHLVMIEEPEAHLHAQLQQVFIRKILEVLPLPDAGFQTQLVVTTHSPHIIYESNFTPIRYFCRSESDSGMHVSSVKNLSTFYKGEASPTREFLQQYIKLTHCDLFFADAAVLVEGNVERLLLPLIIERVVPDLRSCHLTILEVGGAFAHRFENLVTFLDLPTLVITDLDSVEKKAVVPDGEAEAESDDDDAPAKRARACPVDTTGAVSSNPTLKQWLPKLTPIADLLAASDTDKISATSDGSEGSVRVAYQTREEVTWGGEAKPLAGRTLEEAFALQNLDWTQSDDGAVLGLRIKRSDKMTATEVHQKIYERVKSFDKTTFALGVIATPDPTWKAPAYIVDGLIWLCDRLKLTVMPDVAVGTETTEEG